MPNTRLVSARSAYDTAVTASERSMQKAVTGRKLSLLPTRVMSVPCSVVTTLRSSSGAICLARIAAAANGIA